MKKFLLGNAIAMAAALSATSQVAINSEGLLPHPSAILDVRSLGKGMLIPRMSLDDRNSIVSPATGLMIYQTTAPTGFYYYEGVWKFIGTDNLGNHQASQAIALNGHRITDGDSSVGLSLNAKGALTLRQKADVATVDSAAKDNIVIGSDGSFLARGKFGIGAIPATGVGTRMMWWPAKGSLRVGTAVGTTWDAANIGEYSFAYGNQVTASGYGTVAFGDQVTVTGTVGAGFGSAIKVSGTAGFSAGASNVSGGFGSTTLGYTDSAMGQGAVAIGYRLLAREDYSLAFGYRGRSLHEGSIVFSDASSFSATLSSYTSSSAANQFTARYAGGYRLFTNSNMNVGVSLTPSDNSWNIISDSSKKERFLTADGEAMLANLRNLRMGSWNYKGIRAKGLRHYGPMAQEFFAAYGKDAYGTIGNDTTINQANLEGVLMILVKALEARTNTQSQEIAALKKQNEDLSQALTQTTEIQEQWNALLEALAGNEATRVLAEQVKTANKAKGSLTAVK